MNVEAPPREKSIKTRYLQIRISPEEKSCIEDRAGGLGVSISEMVRGLLAPSQPESKNKPTGASVPDRSCQYIPRNRENSRLDKLSSVNNLRGSEAGLSIQECKKENSLDKYHHVRVEFRHGETGMVKATRVEIDLGDSKLVLEGSGDAVLRRLPNFQRLASLMDEDGFGLNVESDKNGFLKPMLERVCKVEGDVVYLTGPPKSEERSGLLILLGQHVLNDSKAGVSGYVLLQGLERSGFQKGRIDRVFTESFANGSVLRSGKYRGIKYRLSDSGLSAAQRILEEVVNGLP